MLPIIGAAAIGAGASLAGGYLGYKGTKKTNEANINISREQMQHSAKEAATQRDYQTQERLAKQAYDTQMSNSAVQRRMDDLKAGGVNPILAGKFDASSPSSTAMTGAMGQLPGLPQLRSPMSAGLTGASEAANTALSVMKGQQEINILKNEVKIKHYEVFIKRANELKARIETYMKGGEAQWKKAQYDVKYNMWQTWSTEIRKLTPDQRKILFIGVPGAAMAATSFAAFTKLALGSVTKLISNMFKVKPKGVARNPEQFIR